MSNLIAPPGGADVMPRADGQLSGVLALIAGVDIPRIQVSIFTDFLHHDMNS